MLLDGPGAECSAIVAAAQREAGEIVRARHRGQERFLPGVARDAAPIAGATTSHRPIVTTIAVR